MKIETLFHFTDVSAFRTYWFKKNDGEKLWERGSPFPVARSPDANKSWNRREEWWKRKLKESWTWIGQAQGWGLSWVSHQGNDMLKSRVWNNLRKSELYSRFIVSTGSYSILAEEIQSFHVELYICVNLELVSSSHCMLLLSCISFSFSPSLFLVFFCISYRSSVCKLSALLSCRDGDPFCLIDSI